MYTLTVLDGKNEYRVSFEGSPTVQQVLEKNGILMPHPCGGSGRCGKCVIDVSGEISGPDEKEEAYGCRLSCRTKLYGDARVRIFADNDILAESTMQDIRVTASEYGEDFQIGAAVDIGTTTVALSIYHLTTGKCLACETMLNPQSAVSADVIGRITAAGEGRLEELGRMILECIEALADRTGYKNKIDRWCITGNTTMLYLLEKKDPETLAVAPFFAEHLFGEERVFFGKPLYLPRCMDAFVGADITCAVLESGMCDKEETALLCDIGTNGEIALWKEGRLYTTSTAAGPVFEGAGISCGCQSVKGAIENVKLTLNTEVNKKHPSEDNNDSKEYGWIGENGLQVQTIGDAEPVGLCGSGVIDAIACLLENGTIDETGAMEEEEVLICRGISLKRQDIRQVQLAKAAIAAGIKTLLEITYTAEEEIADFYIAGGFGSHLNLSSAVRIGLLPEQLQTKVKILGNGALKGAASLLVNHELRTKAYELAKDASCINLGGMSEFNDKYIDEMFFPEQMVSYTVLTLAEELGFSHYGLFDAKELAFRQEVRDMCAAGRCKSYGMRWTCPPHCGTLEESVSNTKKFKRGILLQMTGNMEDDFDVECMQETEQAVKEKLTCLVECLGKKRITCLPMSAGTCTKCAKCTCPDEPCRFPEEAFVSMEAYGLMVNDVCTLAGLQYNYGRGTITFSTCILFEE